MPRSELVQSSSADICSSDLLCVVCEHYWRGNTGARPWPRPAIVNSNMHNWVADISDWRQHYTAESRGFSGEYAFINGNGKM